MQAPGWVFRNDGDWARLVAELIVHVHGGQEAVEGRVRVDPAHWEQGLGRRLPVLYSQLSAHCQELPCVGSALLFPGLPTARPSHPIPMRGCSSWVFGYNALILSGSIPEMYIDNCLQRAMPSHHSPKPMLS